MKLTIKDLANDMSCGGVPFETARNRVSYYATEGLIVFKRSGPNTAPNLYTPETSAVAMILSALTDMGVADTELLREVATNSYMAMDRCLAGLARNESWYLSVNVFRHDLGVMHAVRLLRDDQVDPVLPAVTIRGAMVVVLDELLLPVVRRLNPRAAH